MTPERHKARHGELQDALLELWYDFARHYPGVIPQDTTVGQLLSWAQAEAQEPSDDGRPPVHAYAVCGHCGDVVLDAGAHQCQFVKRVTSTPVDPVADWFEKS